MVFAIRLCLLATTLLLLHLASHRRVTRARLNKIEPPSLSSIQRIAPRAAKVESLQLGDAVGYQVLDANGKSLGLAITTFPEADKVIGYSGASNVLLLLDENQRVQAAGLIDSGDTAEHVAQVVGDEDFWQQFNGLTQGEPGESKVDGVSGATLTSLAIAEGIQLRMSGRKSSLRFPDAITLEEVRAMRPEVEAIGDSANGLLPLLDANAAEVGWVARTGEIVDAEEGYQGPTELLLIFDLSGVLTHVRIRKSFDNEPYVGYVKQEYSFWAKFKGRNLSELGGLDLEREEIEGVSGATMTSLAVARTIRESVKRLQDEKLASGPRRSWNWSVTEIATGTLAFASLIWSRSRWRSRRIPRAVWQLTCFVVIGCWAGNLISLALLAGWTSGGMQIRLAPGLSLLLLIAFLSPMLSKQNVYCDHVCPHGALQQWLSRWRVVRPVNKKKVASSEVVGQEKPRESRIALMFAQLLRWLALTPWLALIAAAGWLLFRWPVPLSWLEPFDAYSWRIGLTISAIVWLFSIGLAMLKPMVYCRTLCPTGKAIDYVRRSSHGGLRWFDAAMLVVALLAWWQVVI